MGDQNIVGIDIEHVAKLARIALTDEEKERFARQLGDVLGHFEKLAAVNIEGVEPMAQAFPIVNVLRADEPGPTFLPEQVLKNAPKARDNQLAVPRVVAES